jgi:hypothetical protein
LYCPPPQGGKLDQVIVAIANNDCGVPRVGDTAAGMHRVTGSIAEGDCCAPETLRPRRRPLRPCAGHHVTRAVTKGNFVAVAYLAAEAVAAGMHRVTGALPRMIVSESLRPTLTVSPEPLPRVIVLLLLKPLTVSPAPLPRTIVSLKPATAIS